ncbi:MAG: SNF2-related protein, partial [Candidatus Aenigmatarchaeota archaeon]
MTLKLKVKLYQHQLKALQFHIDRDKSADWSECGTGKSITALAKFVFLKLKYPNIKCLVLCPASLVLNWLREIQKVSNFKALAVIGTVNQKLSVLDQDADIYICSYDSLRGKQTLLFCRLKQMVDEYEWFIICDEINHIQNIHALRTMFTYWLLRKAKRLIMLSGTPITNDPYKVMNIYRLLNGAFTKKDRFKFFVNVGKYYPKWVLRKETLPEFHKKFYYNAIRFKK